MQQGLREAAIELDHQLPQLRADAQERLGGLFNPADYPATLIGQFAVDWDFPSVQPPDYLLELNPQLYEQERARMVARFEEAVGMAEDAFASELSAMVSHLVDRLTPGAEGKIKTFRDSAVNNVHGFFEQFRSLNINSSKQLDELVDKAQQLLKGVRPGQLRNNESLRNQVSAGLSAVQASLDDLLVDQPRRRIIRPAARAGDAA
jgi:hypothetical protein